MRIKKTTETTPYGGAVVNTKNNSTNNTYSCDYINDKIVNVGLTNNSDFKTNIIHSKNLFNPNQVIPNANIGSGNSIETLSGYYVYYVKVESGKTYTMSTGSTRQWVYNFYTSLPQMGSVGTTRNITPAQNLNFTVPSGYNYIAFRRTDSGGEPITNLMLNIGDTILNYEPYVSPAIVVDGDEIYNKNSLEYSTEEQRIGTWLGKPLYRKVIQTTTSDTANTERRTIIDYSVINIVKLDGHVEFATNSTLPLNTYSDASNYVHTYTNVYNGNTRVITVTTYTSKPITYIVEYTKTTD